MATTLRLFASNIELMLKQANVDGISFNQIVLWSSYFINKYRYAKLVSQNSIGYQFDSGAYLMTFANVPVITPTGSVDPNIIRNRKYIELPSVIYDLNKDEGIKYISYSDFYLSCQPSFTGVRFTRTTPAKARRLYFSEYEKPSPNNPYFYRKSNIIELLGIEEIDVDTLEVGILSVFEPFVNGGLDSILDVGEEALSDITKQVLDLGRFMLLMPEDKVNDSADTNATSQVPKSKLISVNQNPANIQEDVNQNAE